MNVRFFAQHGDSGESLSGIHNHYHTAYNEANDAGWDSRHILIVVRSYNSDGCQVGPSRFCECLWNEDGSYEVRNEYDGPVESAADGASPDAIPIPRVTGIYLPPVVWMWAVSQDEDDADFEEYSDGFIEYVEDYIDTMILLRVEDVQEEFQSYLSRLVIA